MENVQSVLSGKVQAQLAFAAAAVAGTVAGAQSADAALVTTFANTTIVVPASLAGVYLNLLTGAAGGSAGAVSGWDFNPYQSAAGLGFYWSPNTVGGLRGGGVSITAGGTTYADLTPGTVVDSSSSFTSAIQGTSALYRTSGTHTLGFRFVNDVTGALNYGFLSITTSTGTGTGAGFPATINGWQYDDAGAGVTVVPEPTTAAFAALAAGATLLRNRRKLAV